MDEKVDSELKSPEVSNFKESRRESFIFEELSAVDPMDWVNIPKPIQQVIVSIKKCLSSNNKQLNEISDKLYQITTRFKKRLDGVEEKVEIFEVTLKESLESNEKNLKEFKDNLNDEITNFKDKLNKDINFKVKSLEGKTAYTDDQVVNLKKYVNSLPGIEEVEKTIKNRGLELKEIVKEEVNNFYIEPLNMTLKYEIDENKTKTDENIKKIKENADFLELLKNETSSKTKEFEEKTEENNRKMKNSIERMKDYINIQVKQTENSSNDQFEKYTKTIEALNTSLHELNLKYQSQIFAIQKDLDQTKAKNLDFIKNFDDFKKQIEEEKLEDRITEESRGEAPLTFQESLPSIPLIHPKPTIEEPPSIPQDPQPTPTPTPKPVPISKLIPELEIRPNPRKKSVFSKKGPEDPFKQISNLQKYVDCKFQLIEDKLNKELQETIFPLEKRMKEVIFRNESDFSDIREKLAWLPMSFSQIKDKSPTEARIFTLEARLRAEENNRNESVNRIMKMIDSIHSISPALVEDGSLPPIRTVSVVHDRHFSVDSGVSSESIRKQAESELGRFSNAFRPGKSNFLKKFSLKNQLTTTWRENSFINRK
jgi:hypothetical protein